MKRFNRPIGCNFSGHADNLHSGGKTLALRAIGFTKPAASPVSADRAPNLATDRKSDLPGPVPLPPEHNHGWPFNAFAPLKQRLKLLRPPESLAPGNPLSSPLPGHPDI